jgi:dTDP-glucose 4,6-dehydratase
MKIIVTGGLGFIGSRFVNLCLMKGHDIKVVDKLTYAADLNRITPSWRDRLEIIEKDIKDITVVDLGDYDFIVNFAAESHVDNSIEDGSPFIKSNVEGTFNLIECARKNKSLKKFIQISTDEVYGDVLEGESDENHPLNPSSYYSATKTASDLLVKSASRTYGLPYIITRTCNNYGPGQHSEKFLPTIVRSINEGKEIPVYGDGLQVREWIYVDDNVNCIYQLMTTDVVNSVYNIGSGETQRYTNLDLISLIGENVKYKFVKDRLGHDRRYALNSEKYKKEIGSIPHTVKFKDWIKKINK